MPAEHRPSISLMVLALTFSLGVVAGAIGAPVWRTLIMGVASQSYQEATYKCDRAMRHHLIAKQVLANSPSPTNARELEMAEVALLDCQTYDLMRKRLIRWGLTENDLSSMALEAIEAKDRDLQQVIEIHEIRY